MIHRVPGLQARRARAGRLLFALCLGAGGVLAAQQPRTLTGTVLDIHTDSGVTGATILVQGTLLGAITNDAGHFRITGVPAGPLALRVMAIGYRGDTVAVGAEAQAGSRSVTIRLAPAALMVAPVVVSASRRAESAAEASVSVSVVSSADLRMRDVSSVQGALPFVPGVTFNGPGEMDIRGSSGTSRGVGSRVLMMLDGHPMLSADGGEIIWESLPLLDVERVEVVKGAYSAVYGSNALGGVANIITAPIDTAPKTVARVHYDWLDVPSQYQFANGTQTANGVELQHSTSLRGVGVLLAGSRETSAGATQNGNYDRLFLRGKITSAPSSGTPWDGYAIWSRSNGGNFLVWRADSMPFSVAPQYLGDRSVYQTLYLGGTTTPIVAPKFVVKVSPSFSYNDNKDFFRSDSDYHRAWRGGATVQLAAQPDENHTLVAGVQASYTAVRSNFLGTPGIRDGGVFVQDEWTWTPALRATLGGRLDYHATSGAQSEAEFNPKFSLRYLATPALTLRASIGRGFRAPSAIEQFVSAVQFGYRVIPNPDLRGEHAVSTEVGANVTFGPGIQLDAALFQSQYHDLIGPAAAPDSVFVFQFRNVQRARIRGLDVGLKTSPLPHLLDADFTYLYLDPVDLRLHQWLPYRSRQNATASLNFLDGLAGVDVQYRSRVAAVLVYPLDPRGDITLVDLRANYMIAGTVLQAKVSNLFNKVYPDVQERVPGPPRTISVGLLRTF
jgi:iron complex outermembrane receptor protein